MSQALLPNGYVNIDELLRRYVAAGIDADILPGAHTRAARLFVNGGYVKQVRGLDRHHTAQSINMREIDSINYMTFWAPHPVMCNTYPWKDGRLTICAAGPTYTAGKGGPLGEITYGNQQMWSMEIGNNGIGEAYPKAQQDTIVLASAVEAEFFGDIWEDVWQWWRIPAHFEWAPGRKVDPRGPSRWSNNQNQMWDMNAFRDEVRFWQAHLYDQPDPSTPGGPVDFYPVEQFRAADTRVWPKVPLEAGKGYRFNVGGGIPKEAIGVLATITCTQPTQHGHMTVARPGGELFKTSCLNYGPGDTLANTTFVPCANGQFDIASHAISHVVVDVLGYFK